MSTGVDIMLFYKGVTFFPFLHRIYMRIENSFFSSIHYSPGPSGTAVGGKGLKTNGNFFCTPLYICFSIRQNDKFLFSFCLSSIEDSRIQEVNEINYIDSKYYLDILTL